MTTYFFVYFVSFVVQLPSLITRADLKGDLHMHTTESDGRESLETMVAAARERGLELKVQLVRATIAAVEAIWDAVPSARIVQTDPVLVADNPLFGPSAANPSGFEYPAPRSFANLPGRKVGDPAPAPYLGQHSEDVLSERLGLSSGAIGDLIHRGVVARSDRAC